MTKNALIRIEDLVNNPTTRVPICLCLDASGSMARSTGGVRTGETEYSDGQKWYLTTGGTSCIEEMQKGIGQLYEAIRNDDTARYAAEISIVTFNNTATCVEDFANIDRQEKVPYLSADGDTHMGEGVNLALDLLEKRKAEYKDKGVDYFQPWLVLMTDGEPNGDPEVLEKAISRTQDLVARNRLTVFPVGIGSAADMSMLERFSPKRQALHLQGLQFNQFFTWLSQSVSTTSQSCPGEMITLDISQLKKMDQTLSPESGWDQL